MPKELVKGVSTPLTICKTVPADDLPPVETTPTPHGCERILIVEDDDGVRHFLTVLLTEFGYRVAAISGADELEVVLSREQGLDLLITDVVLPGTKNGREVAELVRASIPGVKVIFVSGYTRDAITTNDRMLPGADFLAKPFTQDAILKRIREILDRS